MHAIIIIIDVIAPYLKYEHLIVSQQLTEKKGNQLWKFPVGKHLKGCEMRFHRLHEALTVSAGALGAEG